MNPIETSAGLIGKKIKLFFNDGTSIVVKEGIITSYDSNFLYIQPVGKPVNGIPISSVKRFEVLE